jgi:LCP family protein required for cell wall assembly
MPSVVAPGSSFKVFAGRFAIALVVVVVATAVAVSTGNHWFERTFNDIPTTHIKPEVLEKPVDKGKPANFLIIGTDSRAFVQNPEQAKAFGTSQEVGGQRSDTMMIVHVEPQSDTGFVVSFPRDLWVTIPGHGENRLNAALELGGPSLLIQTLTDNFHFPIHHFLEVDIDGFQKIVNTIGGVNLYFPTAERDKFSGLDQPQAGCRPINGAQALTYVRARHFQWFDVKTGEWRDDPQSDLSRIARQQYFMRSLARAALERGASNPATAFALLDNISSSLQKDQNLQLSDIKALINAFRDLDPQSVEMLTVPVVGTTRGTAQVLVPEEPEADAMINRLRNFSSLPSGLPHLVKTSTVQVKVLNGSGVAGRAKEVLDDMEAYGFVAGAAPTDADRADYPLTQIRYPAGSASKALTAAVFLGTNNVVEARPGEISGSGVVVIVGRDWDRLVAPVKRPPGPTTTVGGATTAPAVASTTTTTTTPPSPSATAVVPVDPRTGGPLVGCPG